MNLRDTYDIPDEIVHGKHSPAFREFLWNWFGDSRELNSGQLDISFLEELSLVELETARKLIRRNLKLRQRHIVQGAAALRDTEAVPILRSILDGETNPSARLVVAGALWNLTRDPIFITCLDRVKGEAMMAAHIYQVLWLDDERAVDFLIDLLDSPDAFVRHLAMHLLNSREEGRNIVLREQLTRTPDDYRRRRRDPAFREHMTQAVQKWNREMKQGIHFGWAEAPFVR